MSSLLVGLAGGGSSQSTFDVFRPPCSPSDVDAVAAEHQSGEGLGVHALMHGSLPPATLLDTHLQT